MSYENDIRIFSGNQTVNIEQTNKSFINTPAVVYVIAGVIALCFRLYLNYSQELIPGVNGGYYPLQVRSVLEHGHLGFSDMPLLFYMNALLIKAISLTGFTINDSLILNVVKLVDSISIPLLLIPLYKIIRLSKPSSLKFFDSSIIVFSVLSFSPLILTSDLQKNALAIVFLFGFIACFLSYLITKKKIDVLASFAYFFLTGLTHFGTFVFAVLFLLLYAVYSHKKKAVIPLTIVAAVSIGMIAVFDLTRFYRLLSFWTEVFEKSALLNGMLAPPDILNILISIFLAISGIIVLRARGGALKSHQKAIIFSSVVLLLSLSFPLLDGEYFKRLSLLLFIPQILLILHIAPVISTPKLKTISIVLFVFSAISVFAVSGRPKETVIDARAYENLQELKPLIESGNETIIIARHGLEWWTAWALQVKVGQDKAIDDAFFEKYKNVIFINQMNGFSNTRQRSPFHEPAVPKNTEMIFSSPYFQAFKLLPGALTNGINN